MEGNTISINRRVGVVGIGTPNDWRGILHTGDPAPRILGNQVFDMWHEEQNLTKDLLNYHSWYSYINFGMCLYCGKKISGTSELYPGTKNVETFIGRDQEMAYHKHCNVDIVNIESKKFDKWGWRLLQINWAYIIEPKFNMLHALVSKRSKDYIVLNGDRNKHMLDTEIGILSNLSTMLYGNLKIDKDNPVQYGPYNSGQEYACEFVYFCGALKNGTAPWRL